MPLRANENKVKFGLKRVAFAIATIAENGSATYDTPVTFPGARALAMEPQGSGEPWYADDGVYYYNSAPTSRQGDLEMARLIDAFKTQVLGYVQDQKGLLLEDMNPETVHFALLFETMNDKRPRRYVMYNCVATAPTVGSNTNEGSKEPQTETSTINSMGIYVSSHDKWFDHAETTPRTDPEAYANWFNAVQVPSAPADPNPVKTKSGAIVVMSDGADNMNMESLVVDIAAETGITEATVSVTGKNVLPVTFTSPLTQSGVTYTANSDGTVSFSGETENADIMPTICAATLPAGTYILTGGISDTQRLRLAVNGTLSGQDTGSGYSFTLTETSEITVQGRVRSTVGDSVSGTFSPMIRAAAITDTRFEKYTGTEYTVDWTSEAGAITSGTLNVVSGSLVTGGQTYTLTPVSVPSKHGINTVFADCGNVTVQYHSDPDLDYE